MTDRREGDLERFAFDCALDAAWSTELWIPRDHDYGFVEYFEAAAARNIGLLRGFEELAEDVDRRGILPQVNSDQARFVTDGGRSIDQDVLPLSIEQGLWIPPELRDFTAQVVFRTPRVTIQHFQSGGGSLDDHYPMIDETHFGSPDELDSAQNPDLGPNLVSIKPQGEEARVFEVDLDD